MRGVGVLLAAALSWVLVVLKVLEYRDYRIRRANGLHGPYLVKLIEMDG
ncbi:hypothetical protein H8B09_00315 [Paenibacillus sp. PR3]|uniref:Uncharacterized protein n=1 Tax=Paenibacillus terricola TaxID=2763503 RepID=A0ABR8MSP6_9BACL|nr:hypothetical protein [Paenibacillus terricola]MBD3917179.1 hypothetical protein [Paenibacillus terricola]